MAQSLNKTVEYTAKANFMTGIPSVGNIIVGEEAFEYYNEKNVEDYIQIPWKNVIRVEGSVYFNKWISRFVIFVDSGSYYTFSAKDNKALLRAVQKHVPADKMLKSLGFFDVMKNGCLVILRKLHLCK